MSLGGYGCQKFILRAHTLALRTIKENTGKERFLSIFQPTIKYTHTHTHTGRCTYGGDKLKKTSPDYGDSRFARNVARKGK